MADLLLQLLLMALETAFAATLLLTLFHARHFIGQAPLYTSVGVIYYLATLLAGSIFIKVTPALMMSPGSVALFPASVFAVLLVYIREDAKEARNMIHGLLVANVSVSLLGLIVAHQLQSGLAVRPILLPPELFLQSPRLFIVGTLTLYADAILIILVYETTSRFVRPLFIRIWLSLAGVLVFDTLLFVTGGFLEHPAYGEILLSGIVGKVSMSMIYALILAAYLPRFGAAGIEIHERIRPGLGNLFQTLTYRQRYEAVRAQAIRDPLTGVYNRRFFDEMLQTQIASAKKTGAPLSIMIVDVDHFKRINDTQGHSEGDRALDTIAKALASASRLSDIVCRYGGEEFCIILPRTPLTAAIQLAERVREQVPAACKRAVISDGERITVTIGLAAFPLDGTDKETLMRAADRRLYQGKENGRDRVVAM